MKIKNYRTGCFPILVKIVDTPDSPLRFHGLATAADTPGNPQNGGKIAISRNSAF